MTKPILTAVIVDDEPTARYGLRSYINKIPSLRCVGEFSDVMSLECYLRDNTAPDIIFMDIQMPEISGIDFIASRTLNSAIVLVTAYEQYAIQGFDLNVCDYLLKPVTFERFMQAVEKASQYMYFRKGLLEENYMFLKADRMIRRIFINDIQYLESMENYVKVVTSNEKMITRATLKELLKSISLKGFIQVHKSFAVNVGKISQIDGNRIVTDTGHDIPLSKKYRVALLSVIDSLLKNDPDQTRNRITI